jgi:hypothetical protein
MVTSECRCCGELFWTEDAEDEKCVTCIELPDEDRRREQAAEQYAKYIHSLRLGAKR